MINKMAMVLRTTDLYNYDKSLRILDTKEKLIKVCKKHLIIFLKENKDIDLFIIIDSKNNDYIKLIHQIYGKYANIIVRYSGSDSGSFAYQIEFVKSLSNKYKYLYVAEDDYIFLGKINFQELNSSDENSIYTNYNHPHYHRLSRRILRKIDKDNYHTLCMSFFLKSKNISNIEFLLSYYQYFSDGEIWALNYKPIIFFSWLIKNFLNPNIQKKKLILAYINLKKNKAFRNFSIKLVENSESIQLSNDGLPLKYSFINDYNKTDELNSL